MILSNNIIIYCKSLKIEEMHLLLRIIQLFVEEQFEHFIDMTHELFVKELQRLEQFATG